MRNGPPPWRLSSHEPGHPRTPGRPHRRRVRQRRRRLERDLHDGAQQRLVSLSLRLGMLATRVTPGSEVDALLGSVQDELAEALKELRDLAHGLHPALLTARGLPVALASLAARATLPVELDADPPRRAG